MVCEIVKIHIWKFHLFLQYIVLLGVIDNELNTQR